jgi:hypothetical protein
MGCSKRRAVRILSSKATDLAISLFESLEQPRSVQALWERSGRLARGPYYLRFNNDTVAEGTSAAFNVAIAMLIGEGYVCPKRGAVAWELVRVGRSLLDSLVLVELADGPLTVPALQARLGRWTRGTDTVRDEETFARIEDVSPVFARVPQGLFATGSVRSFWGPRSIRIKRLEQGGSGAIEP